MDLYSYLEEIRSKTDIKIQANSVKIVNYLEYTLEKRVTEVELKFGE